MKKAFIIYLLIQLLKINTMHVIAAVSEVSVKQKNPNHFISITYSAQETIIPTDERKKALKDQDLNSLYTQNHTTNTTQKDFYKKFDENNRGSFCIQLSLFSNNMFCGRLTVFRHRQNKSDVTYIFYPSPKAKTHPACQNTGFTLEYTDPNVLNFSFERPLSFSTDQEEQQILEMITQSSDLLLHITSY